MMEAMLADRAVVLKDESFVEIAGLIDGRLVAFGSGLLDFRQVVVPGLIDGGEIESRAVRLDDGGFVFVAGLVEQCGQILPGLLDVGQVVLTVLHNVEHILCVTQAKRPAKSNKPVRLS